MSVYTRCNQQAEAAKAAHGARMAALCEGRGVDYRADWWQTVEASAPDEDTVNRPTEELALRLMRWIALPPPSIRVIRALRALDTPAERAARRLLPLRDLHKLNNQRLVRETRLNRQTGVFYDVIELVEVAQV